MYGFLFEVEAAVGLGGLEDGEVDLGGLPDAGFGDGGQVERGGVGSLLFGGHCRGVD